MATRDLQNIVVIIVLNLHVVHLFAFSPSQGKLIDFGKTDINSVNVLHSSVPIVRLCVFSSGVTHKVGESGCDGVIRLV